jgi:hypothetical protein
MNKKAFHTLCALPAVALFAFSTLTILTSGCGASSKSGETTVPSVRKSLRAHRLGAQAKDHYFEFTEGVQNGDRVATLARWQTQSISRRVQTWATSLTPLQTKSMHVTGAKVQGDLVYWLGYFTLSMDGRLSDLSVIGRANGFLLEQNTTTGDLVASTAIRSANGSGDDTVVSRSIDLDGGNIVVKGTTTGGIAIGSFRLQPKSALDQYTVVIDPVTRQVVSGTIAPLPSSAPAKISAASRGLGAGVGAQAPFQFLSGGVTGFFTGVAEASLASVVSSEVAKALPLNNNSVPNQLGSILIQLGNINTQLTTIQTNITNDTNSILGDFQTLYTNAISADVNFKQGVANYFETNISSNWELFRNAIGNVNTCTDSNHPNCCDPSDPDYNPTNCCHPDFGNPSTLQCLTLDMVAKSAKASQVLGTNFNNPTTNSNLNTWITEAATVTSSLYKTLLTQVQTAVNNNGYGTGSQNLAGTLNGYNESLVNSYANLITAYQAVYTIWSTVAYVALATTDPTAQGKFVGWGLPVPNVEETNSTLQNQQALNTWLLPLVQNAFNSMASNIITDEYDTQTFANASTTALGTSISIESGYIPQQAKKMQGMPVDNMGSYSMAQPWSNTCNIYVWYGTGVPNDPGGSFEGTLSSGSMVVNCYVGASVWATNLNLASLATPSTPVNYYFGYGTPAAWAAQLQPQTYSGNYLGKILNPTNFNMGYGAAWTSGAGGVSQYNNVATGSPFPNGTNWNSPPEPQSIYAALMSNFSNCAAGCWETFVYPTAAYPGSVIVGFMSPQGLSTWFWVGSQPDPGCKVPSSGCNFVWQVQCGGTPVQNSSFCSQLPGFMMNPHMPVTNVCVGQNQVRVWSGASQGDVQKEGKYVSVTLDLATDDQVTCSP